MVLAIDIGTTFLKLAVIDLKGKILFVEKKKLIVINNNSLYEMDSKLWSEYLTEMYNQISKELTKNITAVVVSGNGPTLIPVDKNGLPVANAMLWLDRRAEQVSEEVNRKVGSFVPPNFFLTKSYYIKMIEPEIYEKTKHFLSCPEYICYKLTGNAFTALPGEGFEPFYWNKKKLDALNLDSSKFPTFKTLFEPFGSYISGSILGEELNGVPVICGGPDFIMSLLGSGSVEDGILCDRTGTSEGLNFCTKSKILVDGLRTLPHVQSNLYTVAGLISDSGDLVINNKVDELISKYENIIKQMEVAGLNIKEVRIIGGHSSIESLNMKKAKLFKAPVKVYPSGSELIGNAVLGFFVTGEYTSLSSACNNMLREVACYND